MLAIVGGRVLTITNGVIERGTVLVDDGKIVAVGADVKVPNGAEVVDASGKFVMPGLIDAHTHVGIAEESIGWAGDDVNEMTEPATPHLRAIDGINPRTKASATRCVAASLR
jgi:imidazolonepropionase-like amidohydrolase